MIGQVVKATVVAISHNQEGAENGRYVELPGNAKGFLHVGRVLGRTAEARQQTLNELVEGATVDVEVVGETHIDGEPGYRVSQWGAERRKLHEAAELLMADHSVIKATVVRVEPAYAIVDLQNGLQGLLHISRVAGGSPEERTSRFQSIRTGDTIAVHLTEERQPGRVRVAESVA